MSIVISSLSVYLFGSKYFSENTVVPRQDGKGLRQLEAAKFSLVRKRIGTLKIRSTFTNSLFKIFFQVSCMTLHVNKEKRGLHNCNTPQKPVIHYIV